MVGQFTVNGHKNYGDLKMRQSYTRFRCKALILTLGLAMLGLAAGTSMLNGLVAANTDATVYLPLVVGPISGTGGGTLQNGGTVEGPDGVGIGALTDTLAGPIVVSIARTEAPLTVLPVMAQAAGDFYLIGAEEDVFVTPERPFIVAFPVPAGADTAHLALAVLSSGEAVNDADAGLQAWFFLEGQYDENQNLFLATIAGLTDEGRTFVLTTHPDFDSPPNHSPRLFSPQISLFRAKCIHFTVPTDCMMVTESAVADFLTDVYGRIQQDMGFEGPRLVYLHETLQYNPNSLSSLGHTVYIEPHDHGLCASEPAAGYYSPHDGLLTLCLNPAVGLNSDAYHTLVHEYFHATEFAYGPVLEHWRRGVHEEWIIEGMAMSAEESYAADEMIRSEAGGWLELHKVDRPLNAGNLDSYFAQDFWVFYGQQTGQDLAYLQDVLTVGARTEDVVNALGDGERLPPYWEWAKNQVMEKQVNFDNALQNPCSVETQVVEQFEIFQHHWQNNAYHNLIVTPLTTAVVKLTFSHSYDAGFGWVFAPNPSQLPDAEQSLGYKFYKDGESGCENIPDGPREFPEEQGGIDANAVYYVVISNTDYDDAYDYVITFELAPVPPE
jgi:hypothetical protein